MKAPTDRDPELPLRLRSQKEITPERIAELFGLLHQRGWVTANQILALRPEWPQGDDGRRFIRRLASAAGCAIISAPGTRGYCRGDEVELEHLRHAGRSLISQGRENQERGIAYLHLASLREKQARMTEVPA